MAKYNPLEGRLVVLIGGNGFVGTHVAQDLLERGARLRIAARHPEKAFKLKPLANLGQIQFARCNVRDRASIDACMQGADAAAYLVGTFGGDQKALHADGAGHAAEGAAREGAKSFVYISAIGADADDRESLYSATKGLGEQEVREAFSAATVLRPSVMFGQDDDFINMFAGLIRTFPALPVFGANSRFQPLWVDDAAAAVATALADPGSHGGKTYELAGPETIGMLELHERIARAQRRKRAFVPVPEGIGRVFAAIPGTPINPDQYRMLKRGSVASGEHPGFDKLDIVPSPLGLFLDKWMTPYRKHGRFTNTGSMPSGGF